MSDQKFQPRPTEYRGITFRSKSEAKFARLLDVMDPGMQWAYEPKDFESMINDNYCPDFVSYVSAPGRRGLLCVIVEYKPKRPTDAYIKEFFGVRSKRIQDAMAPILIVPTIVCVDFWNKTATEICRPGGLNCGKTELLPAHLHAKNLEGHECVTSWDEFDETENLLPFINEVNSYRFDLKQ